MGVPSWLIPINNHTVVRRNLSLETIHQPKSSIIDGNPLSVDLYYRCRQLSFRSYDQEMLDVFVKFCRSVASTLKIRISGLIPLPTHIRKFTILKSPHVHKKHRDQLEIRTYKRLLELSDVSDETLNTYLDYMKTHLPGQIGLKISRYSYEIPKTTEEIEQKNTVQIN